MKSHFTQCCNSEPSAAKKTESFCNFIQSRPVPTRNEKSITSFDVQELSKMHWSIECECDIFVSSDGMEMEIMFRLFVGMGMKLYGDRCSLCPIAALHTRHLMMLSGNTRCRSSVRKCQDPSSLQLRKVMIQKLEELIHRRSWSLIRTTPVHWCTPVEWQQ